MSLPGQPPDPKLDEFGDRHARLWGIVAAGLTPGVDDAGIEVVRDAFLTLLETWVRERVISGPPADASRCALRPAFRFLVDIHRGFEFVADILLERERQLSAGTFEDRDWTGLTMQQGLGQIASTTWLGLRARSFMAREAAAGLVGMPEKDRRVGSLDIGEDGGLGRSIADDGPAREDGPEGAHVAFLRRLADGRPVLDLDVEAVGSKAVLETAGLQVWPRLDPDAASTATVRAILEAAIVETPADLEAGHRRAQGRLLERLEAIRARILEQPGMTIRTRADLERQAMEIEAARLLWPLIGSEVAGFLGLPSVNAGEQRNTKYRKALPRLLPRLVRLLAGDRDPEEASA